MPIAPLPESPYDEKTERRLKREFLKSFEESGGVPTVAAEKAGVHPKIIERWIVDDKRFGNTLIHTYELAVGKLEAKAYERAMSSPDDPQSASMLKFMLEAKKPNVFRPNYSVPSQLGKLDDAELLRLIEAKVGPDADRYLEGGDASWLEAGPVGFGDESTEVLGVRGEDDELHIRPVATGPV